jgi:RNA polymerase sigma-70 factor (ECF subfamily)
MTPVEGRPLEDQELVERAKRGDVDAYEQLVERHQQAAFRTAYFVAAHADDAEDAAQEAFVKAYRALGQFRSGASFKPWLLAIVANEARNRLRSASRRDSLALRMAESRSGGWGDTQGDAVPSPERAALAHEDRETLLAALNALSEDDRLVIGYRYFLEMSEKEMAEAMQTGHREVEAVACHGPVA